MLTDVNTIFYLQEVNNPMADSCSYAAGLIKNCGVFANANMMLSLNQAQNTCMLNDKSEARMQTILIVKGSL